MHSDQTAGLPASSSFFHPHTAAMISNPEYYTLRHTNSMLCTAAFSEIRRLHILLPHERSICQSELTCIRLTQVVRSGDRPRVSMIVGHDC